ncbi:tripartite tricarboxylate transporter TctB family protein [Roseateles sp. BYS87W]|uniref:Tripartite tricarboxylate transporter TctB family protein n=1 Tax=Pelomonas baiyunensis TaxID=3299026 RepID=A0ABW7H347_9BURK
MKIKSQRDFCAGLLFLGVGVAFAWGATEYAFGSSASPGPGYFPFVLGVLLALLGGIVLFKALTLESEGGDPIGALAWRPLLVVVAAVAVFGAALPRLGLVVALALLVALSLQADRGSRLRPTIVGTLVGTALAALLLHTLVPALLSALGAVLGDWGAPGSRLRAAVTLAVALLGRLVPSALLAWLLVTRAPAALRPTMEVVLLVATLICISCWMFIDGLGLTMPVWPVVLAG